MGVEPRRAEGRFGRKDMYLATAAREILQREFKTPPSVAELARRVGVNQFKLKQMFHHYFHDTPYGVLLKIRMNHAYRLLESARCPVGVAAVAVGYRHASSFTAAFTRHFGIQPKRVAGRY